MPVNVAWETDGTLCGVAEGSGEGGHGALCGRLPGNHCLVRLEGERCMRPKGAVGSSHGGWYHFEQLKICLEPEQCQPTAHGEGTGS